MTCFSLGKYLWYASSRMLKSHQNEFLKLSSLVMKTWDKVYSIFFLKTSLSIVLILLSLYNIEIRFWKFLTLSSMSFDVLLIFPISVFLNYILGGFFELILHVINMSLSTSIHIFSFFSQHSICNYFTDFKTSFLLFNWSFFIVVCLVMDDYFLKYLRGK